MNCISLSNSPDTIKIQIYNDTIIVDNIPNHITFSELMIFTKDQSGVEHNQEVYFNSSRIVYKPDIKIGESHSFIIYTRKRGSLHFYCYINEYDIIIKKSNNTIFIEASPIFASNGIFIDKIARNNIFLKNCLLHTSNYQCEDIQIKRLADKITNGVLFPYGKLKAIHDWVAENIYYDRDSLINDRYVQLDKSGLGILTAKKGVCSGYSNLMTALLRAVGIPSIGVLCFTLRIDTRGGWFDNQNLNHEANHILTLAYVNSRWVIVDVTWDSDNVFENGMFKKKTGLGVSSKYFDSTIPFISSTHKFVKFVF